VFKEEVLNHIKIWFFHHYNVQTFEQWLREPVRSSSLRHSKPDCTKVWATWSHWPWSGVGL